MPAEKLYEHDMLTNVAVGAPSGAGVTVKEYGNGDYHKSVITLTNVVIPVADSGGANGGFGSLKVYDFPEAALNILGCVTKLAFVATGGIGATATLKHSVGTVAEATNDTLDATQANLVPSTNAVLVAGVGAAGGVLAAGIISDGTGTAIDAILNLGVADAGITANGSVTVNGTITIAWVNVGDK
jgi:hypothetical protein